MARLDPDIGQKCFGSCGRIYQPDNGWVRQTWVNVGTGQKRSEVMCPRCAKRGR